MADPTITRQVGNADMSEMLITWNLTTADPIGTPIQYPEFADRTWQFGTAANTLGGSVGAVQGSNTGIAADMATLSDAAGGIALTWNALAQRPKTTIELPLYMGPALTTVGVGAIITVTCLARRATPVRV